MTFGLDGDGFTSKTLQEGKAEIEAAEKALIDAALDVSDAQPIGQINGIVAAADRDVWELAESVYNAIDPDKAEGIALDNLCALTGTYRRPASQTRVLLRLTTDGACTVAAGKVVAVDGHPEVTLTTDTTVTALGPGWIDVYATCTTYGAIPIYAGTVTQMVTPVAHWTAVTNILDAVTGRDIETDTALRLTRIAELTAAGSGTPDAIRADLLGVTGVLEALCFENVTDATDVNGLLPHSINAVVWDGPTPIAADLDIGNTLWLNRSAGIRMMGAVAVNVTDTLGATQVVKFDRATQKPLFITYTLDVDAATFVGNAVVAQTVVDFLSARQGLGDEAYYLAIKAAPLACAGVKDVLSCAIGFVVGPAGVSNIVVGRTEIVVPDTSRIAFL